MMLRLNFVTRKTYSENLLLSLFSVAKFQSLVLWRGWLPHSSSSQFLYLLKSWSSLVMGSMIFLRLFFPPHLQPRFELKPQLSIWTPSSETFTTQSSSSLKIILLSSQMTMSQGFSRPLWGNLKAIAVKSVRKCQRNH